MSEIKIAPVKRFTRTVVCVPDKSITHRAVMFNAAACGKAEVSGILLGEDCLATIDCMKRLGASIELKENKAIITGASDFKSGELYAANSGTTMRLISGLLCGRSGNWKISGDDSLSNRPMNRIIAPLTAMGADITSQNGKAPLTVNGAALHGIDYIMPVASAQVKSAIILAALKAEGATHITEKEITRDHTEIMLKKMGADIVKSGNVITVSGGSKISAVPVTVAGDISSAAFPLIAGIITGGEVTVKNVGLNPTRTGILDIFDLCGIDYEISEISELSGEKTGTVTVRSIGEGKPFTIDGELIPRLVDEIPVLAVLACYLNGDSVIKGAGELRVKESDRITGVCNMINAFGGKACEFADGMVISGVGKLNGGCVFDPRSDHRMAMSAAIAAIASNAGATVLNHECAAVSYPDFWRMLGEAQ